MFSRPAGPVRCAGLVVVGFVDEIRKPGDSKHQVRCFPLASDAKHRIAVALIGCEDKPANLSGFRFGQKVAQLFHKLCNRLWLRLLHLHDSWARHMPSYRLKWDQSSAG